MAKRIDLTGQRFGKLVALEPTKKNNKTAWRCKCDCGNETIVFTFCLRNGNTSSCGCGATNSVKNELGNKYGRLTVQKFVGVNNNHSEWECICECGNTIIVKGDLLRNGTIKSCGCIRVINELGKKYGKLTVIEYAGSNNNNSALWKCQCECGNTTIVTGNNLRKGQTMSCGCIKSRGELIINKILSDSNINYKTQYTVLINGSYYRFDYAIFNDKNELLRLIEFDGEYHYQNKTDIDTYTKIHNRDLVKNNYCQNNNIPLVRIPYWERNNLNLEMLLNDNYLLKI